MASEVSRRQFSLGVASLLAGCGSGSAPLGDGEGPGSAPDAAPPVESKAAPPAGGYSWTSPNYALVMGPGLDVIDNLFEARAGVNAGWEYAVSIRFRATSNTAFSKIKNYWSAGSGYAAGNGGQILIRIFPDNGAGQPNMGVAPLAQLTYSPASNGMSGGKYPNAGTWPGAPNYTPGAQGFFDLTFPSSANPVIGNLYHAVYTNTDATPATNWSTIDCAVSFTANGRNHRWLGTSDWGLLIGSRTAGSGAAYSWADRTTTPYSSATWSGICQITYASGKKQGFSAMETGNSTPSTGGPYLYTINSGKYVQEVFTMPTAMQLAGFSVQTAASAAGVLNWQLLQGGATIGSGTISRPTANYTTISPAGYPNLPRAVFAWEDKDFATPISVAAGVLTLRLAPASGSWMFAGQRNGTAHGFAVQSVPSVGQYFNGSTLVNQYFWNHADNTHNDGNWRVVLQKV